MGIYSIHICACVRHKINHRNVTAKIFCVLVLMIEKNNIEEI